VTDRILLNRYAEQYAAAKDDSERREALVRYLDLLQMAAVGLDWGWSALQSSCEDTASLDDLRRTLYPDGSAPPFFNLKPVMELQEALLQVNNREKPTLFSKPPKTLGKPLDREKQYWLALAAATITVLMKSFGRSEENAAKKVAHAWGKAKRPLPGKATTKTPAWKLLQRWRDKCMSGKSGPFAKYWYRLFAVVSDRTHTTNDDAMINSLMNFGSHKGSYIPKRSRAVH
jgi:hypothetical protein